jgi:hypothetical protein
VAVGLEEVPPAISQDDGAVVRAERRCTNQPLLFEMAEAPARLPRFLARVVQVALGQDANRADGRQRAALRVVDLVDSLTLANGAAIAYTSEQPGLGSGDASGSEGLDRVRELYHAASGVHLLSCAPDAPLADPCRA